MIENCPVDFKIKPIRQEARSIHMLDILPSIIYHQLGKICSTCSLNCPVKQYERNLNTIGGTDTDDM